MNKNSFSPAALAEGRIARGMKQAQLASEIGISRQAISLIEKGENEPKHETLTKLAEKLRLPIRYFYRNPINDFERNSPVFFRKLSNATDMAHAKANVKTKWHYSAYLVLTKYLKRIAPNLPKFSFADDFDFTTLTDDMVEEYAKELRKFWGLGLGPIVGLTPLIEKNGGIIFQMDLEDDISGFSFYANGNIPFIIVTRDASAARNRFNLAHEIGHLVLHAVTEQSDLVEHHKLIEDQAHLFAGAFLFPKERFLDEFFSTDLNYLVKLKQRWGLSVGAIVKRASNLGILSGDEETGFYKRNPGIRKKEPGDEVMMIEHPTFPENGVKAVLEANVITLDDLRFELPYSSDDLSEMFYLKRDFFESTDDAIASSASKIIEFRQRARRV